MFRFVKFLPAACLAFVFVVVFSTIATAQLPPDGGTGNDDSVVFTGGGDLFGPNSPAGSVDTSAAISGTLDNVGFDPFTLMDRFLEIVGPLYLQALVTGFVFTIGWIIYGHFKRGARAM